jgi:CheY-like chemotaxis protein
VIEPPVQETAIRIPDQIKSFALLVDGYVRDLFTTGLILQRLDYDVYITNTAEDAFKIIDAALPALVITELSLPQMSGLEMLVRMRHDPRTRDIPVMVHTSQDDPNREQMCRASGCAAFLKKPADPGVLYRVIQQATEATPRRHIRLRTLLPVRVGGLAAAGTTVSTEYVSELSENGIFVSTLSPRPVNAVLPVTLMIHSIPVKLKAMVLRTVIMNRGLFEEPGMALKFVEISPTDLELLRNFIKGQIMRDIPAQAT